MRLSFAPYGKKIPEGDSTFSSITEVQKFVGEFFGNRVVIVSRPNSRDQMSFEHGVSVRDGDSRARSFAMKVRVTDDAKADLRQIKAFISGHSVSAAATVIEHIRTTFTLLAFLPTARPCRRSP